jgi:hypothetical protein
MTKVKIRILLIVLIAGLSSCEGDISLGYEWTGMTSENANNTSEFPQADNSGNIPASVFAIKLHMQTVELYRNGRYLDTETPPRNENSLDSLIITSDQDFNATLTAGSNLTGLFTILNDNYFYTLPADGSEGYFITKIYADDFYDKPIVDEIDILLMDAPTNPGPHTFTIKMILKDSTELDHSTSPVLLSL